MPQVGRVQRRLPPRRPLGVDLLDRAARAEQVGVEVGGEELPEQRLRPRPDGDRPLLPLPRRLVVGRPVDPHVARHVEVAPADPARLAGPAPGQPLELHQPADVTIQERHRGVNSRVLHGGHRLGLGGGGAALLKPADGGESRVDLDRDQLLGDRPLEHPPHPVGPGVHHLPVPPLPDEPLADGLEGERPELPGRGEPVQLADVAARDLEMPHLVGRPALGVAVVAVGVGEERQQHLVHRDAGRVRAGGGRRGDVEFEEQARERGPGLRAVVPAGQDAEVALAGSVGPHGPGAVTPGGVAVVSGDRLSGAGHRRLSSEGSVQRLHGTGRLDAAPERLGVSRKGFGGKGLAEWAVQDLNL